MAWALVYFFLLCGLPSRITTASPLDIVPTNINGPHGVNATGGEALGKRADCYLTIELYREEGCRGRAVVRTNVFIGVQFDKNTCTAFTTGQDAFRSFTIQGGDWSLGSCEQYWLYLYHTNHCELASAFSGGGGFDFIKIGQGCVTPGGAPSWFASGRLIRHDLTVLPPDHDPRGKRSLDGNGVE
jgi:hypothetical protein